MHKINNIIKLRSHMNKHSNKVVFLLLAISIANNAYSNIKINGKDINTLGKYGEIIGYTDHKENNIFLCVKNGNIEIGSLRLHNNDLENARKIRNRLEELQDQLYKNVSRDEIVVGSGKYINVDGAYISGDNRILLNARTTINISSAILKSKEIILSGSAFKFSECFTEVDTLQIESTNPESIFEIIRFKFNKGSVSTPATEGQIDFMSDETTGDFIVVGAQEVGIQFSKKAFENK